MFKEILHYVTNADLLRSVKRYNINVTMLKVVFDYSNTSTYTANNLTINTSQNLKIKMYYNKPSHNNITIFGMCHF